MIKLDTAKIMQTEMSRKDFLKHLGIGVVAMSGFAAALKAMGYLPDASQRLIGSKQPNSAGSAQAAGFGASVYGGVLPKN